MTTRPALEATLPISGRLAMSPSMLKTPSITMSFTLSGSHFWS